MFRRALTFSLAVGFILIFSDALHAGFTSFTEYRAKLQGSGTFQSYTSYIQQHDDVRSIDDWSPFSSSSSGSSSNNSSGNQYIPWSIRDYLDDIWSGSGNNNNAPISYLVSSSSFKSYTDYIKDLRGDEKDKKEKKDKDKKDKDKDDKDRDHWNRKKDWDKDYWSWYKKHKYKHRHKHDDDDCDDWYDGCKDDWHHDCDPPSHHPEPTSLAMLLGAGSIGLFGRYLRRRVKKAS